MDFELKDVMGAVGPSAALVFAAWLFLQLLQQRYTAAYTRYRELIEAFRGDLNGKRREVIQEEIDVYYKRVKTMMYATNLGMVAAICLLLSLASSGLDAMFKLDWLKYIGGPGIVLGLLLVVPAAIMVIMENMMIKKPIDDELADVKEFNGQADSPSAEQSGQR